MPYELLYKGKVDSDIDTTFFDSKMVAKKNSYDRYEYGIDEGLAVVVKDGKSRLFYLDMRKIFLEET